MATSLCQICKKQAFIIYKINDEHYCPICTSPLITLDINNLDDYSVPYAAVPYTHCFCNNCNTVCRYNLERKHHTLNIYGNFYFAEVVDHYKLNNIKYNGMPIFNSSSYFLNLYNNKNIKLYWKSFEVSDKCSICYETTCHTTECGHFLCETCIPSLTNNTCPICRTVLKYIQPTIITPDLDF
jgi:hypothetical protein